MKKTLTYEVLEVSLFIAMFLFFFNYAETWLSTLELDTVMVIGWLCISTLMPCSKIIATVIYTTIKKERK